MEKKEAMEILKDFHDKSALFLVRTALDTVLPELRESEGERMWKLIKKYAHSNISDMALDADHITREQLESWIEKQCEQKSARSKDDEKMLNRLIGVLDGTNKKDYHEGWEEIFLPWLKSLKDRYSWKPSNE